MTLGHLKIRYFRSITDCVHFESLLKYKYNVYKYLKGWRFECVLRRGLFTCERSEMHDNFSVVNELVL